MKEPIKEFSGVIKGWVETKPNGDKIYMDFSGFIVARYYADRNVTTDFHNFIIGRGDTGMSKVFSSDNKR